MTADKKLFRKIFFLIYILMIPLSNRSYVFNYSIINKFKILADIIQFFFFFLFLNNKAWTFHVNVLLCMHMINMKFQPLFSWEKKKCFRMLTAAVVNDV